LISAVESSFDVAVWFVARARAEHQDMSALRLQRLLYLAQAYFAGSTHGARLMPSMFVGSSAGPIEPNISRIRDLESSMIEVDEPRKAVSDFLEGIWQAFGALPGDRLDQTVLSGTPVEAAMALKPPGEITVEAMAEFYGGGGTRPQTVTTEGEPKQASIPRFHKGRPVTKWVPGQKRDGN
jgi:uncharacterized phage-associated protein